MKKHQEYCEIVESRQKTLIVKLGEKKYLQYENGDIRNFIGRLNLENYLKNTGWNEEKKEFYNNNSIYWTKIVGENEDDPIAGYNRKGGPIICWINDCYDEYVEVVLNNNLNYNGGAKTRFVDRLSAEKCLRNNGWIIKKNEVNHPTMDYVWKKGQEFCEIENCIKSTTIVKLGMNKFLRDELNELRRFSGFLEAANYLSKDGWYLSQISSQVYGGSFGTFGRSDYGTSVNSSELWIMAREVED